MTDPMAYGLAGPSDSGIDVFPMIIESPVYTNAEDAWAVHNKSLGEFMRLVRGYKYWRRSPRLYVDKDFDSGETAYIVRSRVFAVDVKLDGVKEIDVAVDLAQSALDRPMGDV